MSRQPAQIEPYEGEDGREGYLVKTPYSEGFVAELKALPWRDRKWLPDTGWWVASAHLDVVAHLVTGYFGGYEKVDPDTGEVVFVDERGDEYRQGRLFG